MNGFVICDACIKGNHSECARDQIFTVLPPSIYGATGHMQFTCQCGCKQERTNE